MKRGYSLPEAIFSLSLVALVLLFVFNLFPTSALAGRQARQRAAAESLAQEALEKTRAGGFHKLHPGPLAPATPEVDGIRYRVTVVVSPVDGEDSNTLKRLSSTVEWDDQDRAQSLQMECYVYELQR